MELRTPNLGQRVLLPIHHAGLERGEHLGQRHRCGVRAVGLEHALPPDAAGDAQLDAAQIIGLCDRPHVVGDVTKSILPERQQAQPLHRLGIEQRLADRRVIGDPLHVDAVDNNVRHFKDAEAIIHRTHHRGRKEHLQRLDAHAPEHVLIGTELAGVEDADLDAAGEFFVDALCELLGGRLKQRVGEAHVSEPDDDLLLRGGPRQNGDARQRRECQHTHPQGDPPRTTHSIRVDGSLRPAHEIPLPSVPVGSHP